MCQSPIPSSSPFSLLPLILPLPVPSPCPSPQVLIDTVVGLMFCHAGCGGALDGRLLHRDIKPENILLRRKEETGEVVAVLGDFGISKLYPKDGPLITRRLIGTFG